MRRYALKVTKKGATPDDVREAELKLQQAQISLKQTKEGLPDTKKELAADVEKQTTLTDRAKAAPGRQAERPDNTDLRAPARDGRVRVVDGQKIKKGAKAWKGCAIMDLPDFSKVIIKTKIREDITPSVKADQKVLVRVDALPGEQFIGT